MLQSGPWLAHSVNVPLCMALPMGRGMATLGEFQTSYSLEDCYDMLEIIAVDNFNSHQWTEWYKHERR